MAYYDKINVRTLKIKGIFDLNDTDDLDRSYQYNFRCTLNNNSSKSNSYL